MGSSDTTFNSESDIACLEGKLILITGGNKGIGKQGVLDLAKHNPSEMCITTRDIDTGDIVLKGTNRLPPKVSIRLLPLDLASFESAKQPMKTFLTSALRLDICTLNVGMMTGPHVTTEEGYEMQFGVNHLGARPTAEAPRASSFEDRVGSSRVEAACGGHRLCGAQEFPTGHRLRFVEIY